MNFEDFVLQGRLKDRLDVEARCHNPEIIGGMMGAFDVRGVDIFFGKLQLDNKKLDPKTYSIIRKIQDHDPICSRDICHICGDLETRISKITEKDVCDKKGLDINKLRLEDRAVLHTYETVIRMAKQLTPCCRPKVKPKIFFQDVYYGLQNQFLQQLIKRGDLETFEKVLEDLNIEAVKNRQENETKKLILDQMDWTPRTDNIAPLTQLGEEGSGYEEFFVKRDKQDIGGQIIFIIGNAFDWKS
jgi:hypothetical protein